MNTRGWIAGTSLLVTLGIGTGFSIGRARATGTPTASPLTYSATLTDANGALLASPKSIVLQMWDAATAGTQVCTVGPTTPPLTAGTFTLPLPETCVTAVRNNPNLWVEVFVEGTSMNRAPLGAVPYALEADRAVRAVGATGALDTRISAIEAALIGRTDPSNSKPLKLCRGSTPAGTTPWVVYGTAGTDLDVTIDITSCGFTEKPLVIPVLGGAGGHWVTRGGSNPYPPVDSSGLTPTTGFTIYVRNEGPVTPATANTNEWHIEWIAIGS